MPLAASLFFRLARRGGASPRTCRSNVPGEVVMDVVAGASPGRAEFSGQAQGQAQGQARQGAAGTKYAHAKGKANTFSASLHALVFSSWYMYSIGRTMSWFILFGANIELPDRFLTHTTTRQLDDTLVLTGRWQKERRERRRFCSGRGLASRPGPTHASRPKSIAY